MRGVATIARRIRLIATSIAYARPQQVLRRISLLAKRHTVVRLARRLPSIRAATVANAPDLAETLPLPPFRPRNHLVDDSDGTRRLRVLGWSWPIVAPVEWHPRQFTGVATLEEFNLQYMEYLEALDDTSFTSVVLDWIERNPPFGPRYWLGGWSSFALSSRCVVWLQQLALRDGRIPIDVVERMRGSLARQARFLERNLELDIGGNHLIKNIKALLWLGRCFTGDEASRWQALGERLLVREIEEQVLPDGMHFELSPAYHLQVFADLLECREALHTGAVRDALDAALHRMAQVAVDLTHPDGLPSLFADGGLHMAYSPSECIVVYERLFDVRPSPRRILALPDAGYYGLRDGESYVLVDCGRVGPDRLPAHGHGDILAFEWSVRDRRLIVDTGVLQYRASPQRDYARATRAHNTVTVDDANQAEFYGEFRVGRRPCTRLEQYEQIGEGFSLTGSHDGFRRLRGHPIHRRTVLATPSRIEVIDEVVGGEGQPVTARLLLHPDCSVVLDAEGARITCGDISVAARTSAQTSIAPAPWFSDFGCSTPTFQLVLDYGTAPTSASFVLEIR